MYTFQFTVPHSIDVCRTKLAESKAQPIAGNDYELGEDNAQIIIYFTLQPEDGNTTLVTGGLRYTDPNIQRRGYFYTMFGLLFIVPGVLMLIILGNILAFFMAVSGGLVLSTIAYLTFVSLEIFRYRPYPPLEQLKKQLRS